MPSSTLSARYVQLLVVLVAVVLCTACDLPTEPPRFDLSTGLNAPLLMDKTFVLLGPDETGFDALIDTVSGRFDSMFTVDASNQTIAITQELAGFDMDLPAGLLPTLAVDPVDVSFSAEDLSTSVPPGSATFPFRPDGESFGDVELVDLDIADIRFSTPDDYVELSSGMLRIEELLNEFDVSFDELLISIPSLRRAPYDRADSLVIRFEDAVGSPGDLRFHQVDRKSGPRNEEIDLSGYRLYASGHELSFSVLARNETSDDVRYVDISEQLRLSLRIDDVVVSALSAEVEPVEVPVSEDVNRDGRFDVLDDAEANVVSFDGLNVFDEIDLSDVQLAGSELRLNVRSNIAADFALYAVVVGLDERGEAAFLEGKGSTAVEAKDPAGDVFSASGVPLDPQHVIRIELNGAPSSDQPVERTIVLNEQNSNVNAFISRLPTEMRMVASLVVQPDGGRVELREPFQLETSFGATIPLAISSGVRFDKTIDADLSSIQDVISDAHNATIDEAEIELVYGNGLPLGLDLQLDVLDAQDGMVASFPKQGQAMRVEPALTDESGIATQPTEGTFALGVSRGDLDEMSRGERIRMRFALTTNDDARAHLRATDTFRMRLRGSFRVRITAD